VGQTRVHSPLHKAIAVDMMALRRHEEVIDQSARLLRRIVMNRSM